MSRDTLIQSILSVSENVRRQWKTKLEADLAGETVTLAQVWALSIIAAHSSIHSRKLAETLSITSGAVTQLVDSLVAEKLVARRTDPNDRRVTHLSLTAEGQKKYAVLRQKRLDIFIKIFEIFSDEELSTLLEHQEKILHRLNALDSQSSKTN